MTATVQLTSASCDTPLFILPFHLLRLMSSSPVPALAVGVGLLEVAATEVGKIAIVVFASAVDRERLLVELEDYLDAQS